LRDPCKQRVISRTATAKIQFIRPGAIPVYRQDDRRCRELEQGGLHIDGGVVLDAVPREPRFVE
jgi:hypothetical protein